MGSMDQYSQWPLPPYIQQCRRQQTFGGLFPYTGWDQQPFSGWSRPEDLRQIEMWKCDHCGSRFQEKPEKCKNCGSTDILRFDQPGRAAAQWLQQPWSAAEAMAFGPLGIPPKQLTVSEAVAEFRQEVAKIRGPRRCWLSRCWSRFLDSLDRSGYR